MTMVWTWLAAAAASVWLGAPVAGAGGTEGAGGAGGSGGSGGSGGGGWSYVETDVDDYIGWYAGDDGALGRVTWDVDGDLYYFDFTAPRANAMVRRENNVFEWAYSSDPLKARTVTFQRGEDGDVEALHWSNGAGESGRMPRTENAGYAERQVRFTGAGGVDLVGTLMTPRGEGPFPAAVIIHGSGTSSRANQWAATIADHLALHGVAVLYPDKRGSGMSGGDWRGAGFDVLAEDAIGAMRVLRDQSRVGAGKLGIVGLSQGGWIAPLAAREMADMAFVVDVSGTVLTPGEQLRHEVEQDFRNAGLDDAQVGALLAAGNLGLAWARTGEGWEAFVKRVAELRADPSLAPIAGAFKTDPEDPFWTFWRQVVDFDAMPIWRDLEAPTLFVFGAEDAKDNVPIEATERTIATLKKEARSGDVTLRIFPGLGHGLIEPDGWVSREFLDLVSEWIAARVD